MLDIQFIRDNPELVADKSRQKGYEIDVQQLLGFDSERRELLQQVEDLRRQRNELTEQTKGQKPSEEQIAKGRELRDQLGDLEHKLAAIEQEFETLLKAVPNMPLDDVPVGSSEEDNVLAKTVGQRPNFDFEPKQHHELAEPKDWIDKERAAKIAGSRFAYLKGDLVRLQFAIIQWVMQTLGDEKIIQKLIEENGLELSPKPFTPVLPPAVLRTEPYAASARLNAEEVTYQLAQDDLWLNASAEHTLCTMYWNEILPEDMLPIRYLGYSTSFRREAGTYGKDTEGIFRMHQFDKLEMEVFSTPETGLQEHLLLIAIQEYLVQQLGLPYQMLQKSTFDIGKPNARGVDLEVWLPGQGQYRETHTADYMTDYQARDLKIRLKRHDGQTQLVHTNDATAFALGRIMIAILENYQTADGNIKIPDVLQPFMGAHTEI
ncbi:MAG TPA: serine--tRNA ligase [Candidatus Saccharimonadales bacterium]|jgi:seryl-tRNA synthetase|nr:serine--tRNA ligase [Candidatus Saccharimonadales bacterium]